MRRLGKRQRCLIIASGACFIAAEIVEATVLGLIDGNGFVRTKSQFLGLRRANLRHRLFIFGSRGAPAWREFKEYRLGCPQHVRGHLPDLADGDKNTLSLPETQAQTSGAPATRVLL